MEHYNDPREDFPTIRIETLTVHIIPQWKISMTFNCKETLFKKMARTFFFVKIL